MPNVCSHEVTIARRKDLFSVPVALCETRFNTFRKRRRRDEFFDSSSDRAGARMT